MVDNIIYSEQLVTELIKELNSRFEVEYKNKTNLERSAENYYTTGSCSSYARILQEIYDGNISYYTSSGHVIVKIGENFYDVNGLLKPMLATDTACYIECAKNSPGNFAQIEELYSEPFRFCDNDEYEMAVLALGRKEDKNFELPLIEFGKACMTSLTEKYDISDSIKHIA